MLTRFLIIVFAASACYAQTEYDSLIAGAPGLETYPQASVVILRDYAFTTLLPSGHKVFRREFLCKILDERAKDGYGDQSVRFEADEDTVIIEIARTRLPDGTWIEPEPDAFTLTSAPEVQWASAYSQLKQQNVSFPGMAVGAAIHFIYRIEPKAGTKPQKQPQASGIALFGGYEPNLDKRYGVEVSPPWSFRFDLQNGAKEPGVASSGEIVSYEWTFRDCPQIIREPNSVGISELVPRILWTTMTDWEALGVYVADRFWEKVDSSQAAIDGYLQITSPELQGIPALMNAANWVLWNIRTVNLPLGSVGYEPNSADRVWKNRYGDPRDKSVLLTALLRAYGYEPLPVLVPNTRAPFSNLPVLRQFGHIILAIPTGEDTMWIDPTAEFYPPGVVPYACTYGKGCMLIAGAPLLLDVPKGSPESRGANTEFTSTLNNNGALSGTIVCLPHGDREAEARATFKDQKAQELEIYKQSVASRIGQGTEVTHFSVTDPADLSEPMAITLGFMSPDYAVRQGDMMFLEIPPNPFGFGLTGFNASLPVVKYPVQLPPKRKATIEYYLELPKDYHLTSLPPPVIIDNPYLNLEIVMRQTEGGLKWIQSLEIKSESVSVADYPIVRSAFEAITLPKNRLVVLEKKSR